MIGQVPDPQLRQEPTGLLFLFRPGNGKNLQNRHDVLFNRQFTEDGRLLRQVSDPLLRPQIHRTIRDIFVV